MRLLWLLRALRLRALRQGEPTDGYLAGASEEIRTMSCGRIVRFCASIWTSTAHEGDRGHLRGCHGPGVEQPADLVLITAFPLNNVRMLLLSGIGKPYDPKSGEGVVGRNYSYQTTGGATVFMDESINVNPFMASGANGTMIDDFGGDNFDHGPLGFIGGQYVGAIMTDGRPIEFHPTPPGTPKWGLEWKEAVARHYNHTVLLQQHGTSTASRLNYLDLDPTYKDAWGSRCCA